MTRARGNSHLSSTGHSGLANNSVHSWNTAPRGKWPHESQLMLKDNLFKAQKQQHLQKKSLRSGRRPTWVNTGLVDEFRNGKMKYREGRGRRRSTW